MSGATTAGSASYRAVDPRTGQPIGTGYRAASHEEVEAAAARAAEVFGEWAAQTPALRAGLLRRIAAGLLAAEADLVAVADRETALGGERLAGEVQRAASQFELFAELLERGGHLAVAVEPARERAVPPRPDLRRTAVPLGPVAVFGASNFPFAFSVAGGDTASALAAGCPVVCKYHPAHPATSEASAAVVRSALDAVGMPEDVFQGLHGPGADVGRWLVEAGPIAAAAFTGSEAAGRSLFDAAARRSRPIPVFAEMSSLNPVFVLPAAAARRGEEIAESLAGSVTLGGGQFCTKPGLIVRWPEAGEGFAERLAAQAQRTSPAPFLTPAIAARFDASHRQLATRPELRLHVVEAGSGNAAQTVLVVECDPAGLKANPDLLEEHFGPLTVVVGLHDEGQLEAVLDRLPGSLTATVIADPEDAGLVAELLPRLSHLAGRLVYNGVPTGVAVAPAQHHGGPYPAASWPHFTSVGAAAIDRFLRPLVYQGFPVELLPPELAFAPQEG